MFLIKYLFVSVIIFLISFFGLIYNKKSILIILISIELILLSVNILFIVFSIYLDDIVGKIISFNINFKPSVNGCKIPEGPTTFGPFRR